MFSSEHTHSIRLAAHSLWFAGLLPLLPPPLLLLFPLQIKFFKTTMFRKTIETKSLGETRQVWESFIDMVKDAVQKRKPGECARCCGLCALRHARGRHAI